MIFIGRGEVGMNDNDITNNSSSSSVNSPRKKPETSELELKEVIKSLVKSM